MAGLQGVRQGLRLPPACGLDPGLLSEAQRAAAGIARLPGTLGEAIEAFDADAGAPLVGQGCWLQAAGCVAASGPPVTERSRVCCCACSRPRRCPLLVPGAEFGGALAAALGAPQLPRAFMAVRRSEWERFGQMPAEEEAAALYARY